MAFGVLHAAGFAAFLFLIPLIILYLIKPRPEKLKVPSLMFFMKDIHKAHHQTFFRKFVSDPLFWLQFLIFILLALAITDPWMDVPRDVAADHTVIVLDVSASTQAEVSGEEIFASMQERALSLVSDSTTIILAGSTPLLALEDADRGAAQRLLRSVQATDTESAIGDAVLLAGELLAGEPGRVYVLSDFISTKGMHPDVAKGLLESREIVVDFISYAESDLANIGIVDVAVDERTTSIYVKNYLDAPVQVPILVNDVEQTKLSLSAGAVEPYLFSTLPGVTKIALDVADDFTVDNEAFVSVPDKDFLDVLLVTSGDARYMRAALEASGVVSVRVAEPPIVPTSGYDVYVFADITLDDVLHGTVDEILESIATDGGGIIFSGNVAGFDTYLPVDFGPTSGHGVVSVHSGNRLTQDVEFGAVTSYVNTTLGGDAVVLATADATPIIVLSDIAGGQVLYSGISAASSDFMLSPSYPIFWSRVVKYLGGWPELSAVNLRTGDSVSAPGAQGLLDLTLLDKVGIFTVGGHKVAVNLADERESHLVATPAADAVSSAQYEFSVVRKSVRQPFLFLLALCAFVLLLAELFFLRRRGAF